LAEAYQKLPGFRHPVSRNMAGYWQLTGKAERALVGWTPVTGLAAAEAPWVSG
jgi:hypothetical protein